MHQINGVTYKVAYPKIVGRVFLVRTTRGSFEWCTSERESVFTVTAMLFGLGIGLTVIDVTEQAPILEG